MAKGSLSTDQVAVRRARNARRSASARDRRAVRLLADLRSCRADLDELRSAQLHVLGERDEIVRRARALGLPWSELASASGTTKQALMRRVGGVDEDGAHADEG